MSVCGGKNSYKHSEIEEHGQYKAEFFYNGNLPEGSELDNIKFTADISEENLGCGIYQKQDAYYFNLQNKGKPYETSAGSYTLELKAVYTDENQNTAEAGDIITFDITSELHKLELEFEDGQDFFKISGLDSAKPVKAFIKKDGRKLSGEEFKAAEVKASTDGTMCKVIIKLEPVSRRYTRSKNRKAGIADVNVTGTFKQEADVSVKWPVQIFLKVDKDVTKNLKGEKKTNSTFEFSAFNAAGKPVGFNGNI